VSLFCNLEGIRGEEREGNMYQEDGGGSHGESCLSIILRWEEAKFYLSLLEGSERGGLSGEAWREGGMPPGGGGGGGVS